MSICRSIFNKSIYELTLQDLEDFFSIPQEENSVLEFKSGKVAFEKVHVEVSAFLNTEGGLLIIGTPEETPNAKGIKVCQGRLTPCSVIKSVDILSRSIASNISPSPVGIKIQSVECDSGNVFVVEIPQSVTPPHQVDGKYYIRLERDAKAAPHGIVEALFFKRQKSNLVTNVDVLIRPNIKKVKLQFILKNTAIIHAERIGYLLEVSGFKNITSVKNLKENEVIDDYFNDQTAGIPILVRGMAMSFEIEGELRFPFVGYKFNYYSQDSQMESLFGIYYTEHRKHLFLRDTQHPENNISTDDNFGDYYSEILKNEIRLFFQNGSNEYLINDPALIDNICLLEHELEINFPLSYVQFLLVTDGATAYFDQGKLHIFCIDLLKKVDKEQSINNDQEYIFLIGEWANVGLFLIVTDNKVEFRWFSQNQNRHMRSTSFYDIMDDIRGVK